MGAFTLGFESGARQSAANQARKQALSDHEFQTKVQDLIDKRTSLVSKIPALKGTPDYEPTVQALTQVEQGLRTLYHPENNPGAIAKFGHLLTDHLGLTSPDKRKAQAQAKTAQGQLSDLRSVQSDIAAAPLSAEQQAQSKAASDLASFQAAIKNWKILNPSATPEEERGFIQDLIQKSYGTASRGNWVNVSGKLNDQPVTLLFDKNTRQYRTQSGDAIPPEIIDTFKPDTKTSVDASKRADYASYLETHPKYEKNGGTYESWTALQSAAGRQSAPKPETLDNQYKAILVKEQSGQPLNADEKAHKAAWQIYNRETKIDPGVARAAAFGAMRYIPVLDPSNPENVIMMRAGDAAKYGVNTPQSIAFKTDTAITRYMTSGAGGTNITYFNTATDHLRLLKEAGEALNNGDYPLFNRYANQFSTATGDPAPTNFEAVKTAVAGELSKTFKGTGATDSEIGEINQTINQAQSPQQIQGAIDYYSNLMGSKIHALQLQYEAGKSGKPNFPGSAPTHSPQNETGNRSDTKIIMKLKDGQTGKIHRSQKEKFIKDYPGATEVNGG